MSKQPNSSGPKDAGKSRDLNRQISGLLQSMYGAVQNEPIPERFLDLLEKLDAAENAQKTQNPA